MRKKGAGKRNESQTVSRKYCSFLSKRNNITWQKSGVFYSLERTGRKWKRNKKREGESIYFAKKKNHQSAAIN